MTLAEGGPDRVRTAFGRVTRTPRQARTTVGTPRLLVDVRIRVAALIS